MWAIRLRGQASNSYMASLDYNGNAFICTNSDTHLGAYTYNAAANNYYNYWWTVNAAVTVSAYVPPQQPTSLTFIPNSGYAGLDCYTMSLGNASGLTVDLKYTF